MPQGPSHGGKTSPTPRERAKSAVGNLHTWAGARSRLYTRARKPARAGLNRR
jgi:hypothetical protein